MSRILLAWEYGQGFGHVQRLLPIAEAMRSRGHDCVFAVPDVVAAYAVLTPRGFPFVPAARKFKPNKTSSSQTTPAEIIGDAGFDNIPYLRPNLAAWDGILALARPELIVADLAPTICLASRGMAIPVAVVGNHTSVPTPEEGATELPSAIREAVDAVQKERGRPGVSTYADIFNASAAFVTTLPELDKRSGSRPAQDRCGPLGRLPPPARQTPSVHYFAYLSYSDSTDAILKGLVLSKLRGSVMLRDARPDTVDGLRAEGLTIYTSLQELSAELPEAAMLLHHGGPGTMAVGMAVGRPQLLFPNYREQVDYAIAARDLAAARIMPVPVTPERVAGAVVRMLRDEVTRTGAAKLAASLARRGPFDGAERIADALERLLGSAGMREAALSTAIS